MIDHLAADTEKMRIAMRDNFRRGCSKSCEREGGWMKECPCLEIAQICVAVTRTHELHAALRKQSIAAHFRMTHGGGTVLSGGSCELCGTEWSTLNGSGDRIDGKEHHKPDCLLFEKETT